MSNQGLNKVLIIGHLGRDAEMKYTATGKAITTFSVAVSRVTRPAEGETGEETEWFRVVAWDKLAETCNQYLRKGSKVYVEGRLQTRKWTDGQGAEQKLVEVIAGEMMMLDSRPNGQPAGAAVPARDWTPPGGAGDEEDESIPF